MWSVSIIWEKQTEDSKMEYVISLDTFYESLTLCRYD